MPVAAAARRAPALARGEDRALAASASAVGELENGVAAVKRAEHALDHQLQAMLNRISFLKGEEAKLDRNINNTRKRMSEALHRKAERIQCSDVASTVQDALSTLQPQTSRGNSMKGRSSVIPTAVHKPAAGPHPIQDVDSSGGASDANQHATPSSSSQGCSTTIPESAASVPPWPVPQRDLSTMGSRKAARQSSHSSNKSARSITPQQQASLNGSESSSSSTPAASQPSSNCSSRVPSRQGASLDITQRHRDTCPADVLHADVVAPVDANAAIAATADEASITAPTSTTAVQHSPSLNSSGMLLLQAGSAGRSSKKQAVHVGCSRSTQLVSSRTTGSGKLVPSSALTNCMVCLDNPAKQIGQSSDLGWLLDAEQLDLQLTSDVTAPQSIPAAPTPLLPASAGTHIPLDTHQADEGANEAGSDAKVVVAAGVGWGLGPKGAGSTSASLYQSTTTPTTSVTGCSNLIAATATEDQGHSNDSDGLCGKMDQTRLTEVGGDKRKQSTAAGSVCRVGSATSSCIGSSRKSSHGSVRAASHTGGAGTACRQHTGPAACNQSTPSIAKHVECSARSTSQGHLHAKQQQARGSAAAAEPSIKLKQQIWRMRRAFGLEQAVIKDSCAHVQEFGAGAWQ